MIINDYATQANKPDDVPTTSLSSFDVRLKPCNWVTFGNKQTHV